MVEREESYGCGFFIYQAGNQTVFPLCVFNYTAELDMVRLHQPLYPFKLFEVKVHVCLWI